MQKLPLVWKCALSLTLAFSLVGCNLPGRSTPAEQANPDLTATAQALETLLAQASTPTAITTPTPELAASHPFDSNGVQLLLPAGVGGGIQGALGERVEPTANRADWEIRPQSIVLTITDYTGPGGALNPVIQIFPLKDFELISPKTGQAIKDLRKLLSEKPSTPDSIPYLPLVNGSQVLRSQVRYFNFANGSGVRFLTQYDLATLPVNNQGLAYLFQGITKDGNYLVSASFPVKAPFLQDSPQTGVQPPADGVPFPQNITQQSYQAYITAISQKLEQTGSQQFTPQLGLVDALMTALNVQPTILAIQPTPLPGTGTVAPTTAACTDIASFANETVPDNTTFGPGQVFTKTWTLKNTGTCTWSPQYSLVFSTGELMGASNPQPFTATVPPNSTMNLSLKLTAPANIGNYKGEWKLQNPTGGQFGLGGTQPIWVRINVSQAGSGLNLGSPLWIDTFDKATSTWFLGDDGYLKGEIKDGSLNWTAPQTAGDRWRVAYLFPIASAYLEARFKTGPACSGKDGYGLLLRATTEADQVVDSGYILGVSCDGQFRFYKMIKGMYKSLQEWTSSPAILAGPNQENVVGVWFEGDHYKLYINQQMVAEGSDASYFTGLFGLMVSNPVTANYQVSVSEIAYWAINK